MSATASSPNPPPPTPPVSPDERPLSLGTRLAYGASAPAENLAINSINQLANAVFNITLGVPIRNNQGIGIGLDLQKYFSQTRVVTDLEAPAGAEPDSVVFDLTLAVTVAYQMWF